MIISLFSWTVSRALASTGSKEQLLKRCFQVGQAQAANAHGPAQNRGASLRLRHGPTSDCLLSRGALNTLATSTHATCLRSTDIPSEPQPAVQLKLPLICLPAEAADEVAALFDALVKARLADCQQQHEARRVSPSSGELMGQQTSVPLDVDEQHLVVAQVHQLHINPICKDLATILCDPPAPYHRLKRACDRLIPKLVSYDMPNCHAVVRGWLALMEDEEAEHQGPSMVQFLSQARLQNTGLTLEQAIGAGVECREQGCRARCVLASADLT